MTSARETHLLNVDHRLRLGLECPWPGCPHKLLALDGLGLGGRPIHLRGGIRAEAYDRADRKAPSQSRRLARQQRPLGDSERNGRCERLSEATTRPPTRIERSQGSNAKGAPPRSQPVARSP